jgi:pilus assembly protein CpaD
MPNFGCANQHNLAAMIADPRDLIQPREMGDGNAARRTAVIGHYERGEVTSATKTQDQTSAITDVKQ